MIILKLLLDPETTGHNSNQKATTNATYALGSYTLGILQIVPIPSNEISFALEVRKFDTPKAEDASFKLNPLLRTLKTSLLMQDR